MGKYYWTMLSIHHENTGKSDNYCYRFKDFIGRPSEWLPFVETSNVLDFLMEYKAKHIKEDESIKFCLEFAKRIFPHGSYNGTEFVNVIYEGGDYGELCCVLNDLMEENRTTEDLEEMIDELVYEKEKELNSPPISFCIKCKGDFEFRKLEFDTSKIIQDFVDSRKGHPKLSSVANTIALLDDAGTYQVEDFVIKAGREGHKELPKGENHFETIIRFFYEWYKELDKCDLDNYIEQRKATRKFIEKYVEENWFYSVIKA